MPLQNRVSPLGELFADSSRGLVMGNRGGRIHRKDRTLTARRWTSQQWICCRLDFNDRRREVWGDGYTELFFLDEVTALTAGHRPCFECRRNDAQAFSQLWARASETKARPRAEEMDLVLHAERLDGKAKRLHRRVIDGLPDGACIVMPDTRKEAAMLRGDALLRWTPHGYAHSGARLSGIDVDVLTPPSILAVLKAGYRPLWHPSADAIA